MDLGCFGQFGSTEDFDNLSESHEKSAMLVSKAKRIKMGVSNLKLQETLKKLTKHLLKKLVS